MKKFDRETFELIEGLRQEIEDANDPRYAHRLHCMILILQGMSAREVASLFRDSPRNVQRWAEKFRANGLSGLCDADRPGPNRRLSERQILELGNYLRASPNDLGMSENLWDGKALSAFIRSRYGIFLGVRQCQKLFHEYGFRLRKPRPELGGADPIKQKAYKKTSDSPRRSGGRSLVG